MPEKITETLTKEPWELVDTAQIPGDGGELQLYRQAGEFSIHIAGGGVLMNSWAHQSEDALAEVACKKVARRPKPRVLIGGLGMGFTLAAALRHLGADAEVVVAELVPGVVAWNTSYKMPDWGVTLSVAGFQHKSAPSLEDDTTAV